LSSIPQPSAGASGAEATSPSEAAASPEPLSALAYFGDELAAAPTLPEGFARAMSLLDARLGARRSALLMADPSQKLLVVEASHGMPMGALRPRFGTGVAGRVVETGLPVIVPLVRREPMAVMEFADPSAWREEPLSLVCVPVSAGARCIGALAVYFVFQPSNGFRIRLTTVQIAASLVVHALRGQASSASPSEVSSARAAFEYANMIGTSAAMRQVYEEIGQVARSTATALILGESGTGKELVAEAIHSNSGRSGGPFIKINSAAFPDTLFESELFGHERGAFTGALSRKKGRIDRAQGGTLFLDEIGDLPLSTQVKLLRVLQSREYERLGGTETLKADVRVIAATNKDLTAAVAAGTFREDLYYRLDVFTITVPPLRERRADIPDLARYFLEKLAREHGRSARRLTSAAVDCLCAHTWPGNVRELQNAVERAVVSCPGVIVDQGHLPESIRVTRRLEGAGDRPTMAQAVAELERGMIREAVRASAGNVARAARTLGTTERILRYKIDKYGLHDVRSDSATLSSDRTGSKRDWPRT